MNPQELWQAVLAQIQLNTSKANFATWFSNTKIVSLEDGIATVSTPNSFAKEWLEKKYNKEILKILRALDKNIKGVNYKVETSKNKTEQLEKIKNNINPEKYELTPKLDFLDPEINKDSNLNSRYKFDNFIVGPFNELAHAAARAVAQEPGTAYNPLFIYGGVGLGKTHLLQAIGNEILNSKNQLKVKYLSSEVLISKIVNSIRQNCIEKLKNNLKTIDVLIVDDVQFFAGKEKTQEEFFHAFNGLYQKNKQIVLSSDRPPKAIPAIAERLRSRFMGGMVVDIGLPDFETRVAILEQKSQEKNVEFPKKILEYIASNIQKNIRELESALNRLIIFEKVNQRTPTFEEAKNLLKNIIVAPAKITTSKQILQSVIEFYGIDSENLFLHSRKKEYVKPRQITMYLLKKELNLSFSSIGQKFGGKDHSTVMHAYELINKEVEENPKFSEEIELILQRVYGG